MCDRETERQRECVSVCVYEMKYIYMYMYIHCIYTMYFHNAPRVHDMYMYMYSSGQKKVNESTGTVE